MNDKEFLQWIYTRLEQYYEEDARVDYMRRLQAIIQTTDPDQLTRHVCIFSKEESAGKQ